ncbi:OmpP1/FadL family transporter [Luteirhabdus pelagi]|uniref:OmpP1/FadL family transporter n=1 Tax=Luteirhabdus pelagi TaxID=2792783 RepID=UPI00193AC49F|nr:transporter [Luteirhabdus pelagi]
MNKMYIFLIAGFFMTQMSGQNIDDGLRYSLDDTQGTARFTAMSGAFGALGGDVSSLAINPAGSAVLLQSEMSMAASVFDIENNTNYFNTNAKSFENDLSLSHIGGAYVFPNDNSESPWKKFTIGLNYTITRNFDNDLIISGNGSNSIGSFFLSQAQGIPLNLLQLQNGETIADLYSFLGETQGVAAQNAFLAYQGYIIDPVAPTSGNTEYTSNVGNGPFSQDYLRLEQGYRGKYTFNFATQFKEHFYFGINLNSHVIDYQQTSFLSENTNNSGDGITAIGFENNLSVLGAGFSAQFGAIAKINKAFRIGFTYDTPTWFEISEETSQYLETERTEGDQSLTSIVDPRVVNVYADYNLRTPGKLTASAAYVFGENGLLSVDYMYKDYSNIHFSPEDVSFASLNTIIENTLTSTSGIRVGGEYRINQFSLRGGYRYEQSPYEDSTIVGDLTGFSAGAGYNFGAYSFDIAYSRAEQDRNQQMYAAGLTDPARVNSVMSNYMVSFTLRF